MSEPNKKILLAEFVGWGFPHTDFYTDAQIQAAIDGGLPREDVHRRRLGSTATMDGPVRGPEGQIPGLTSVATFVFPVNRSFGFVEGMFFDLHIEESSEIFKWGTLFVKSVELAGGGNVEVQAGVIDITSKGLQMVDASSGPITLEEQSFVFLYLPRSFTTDTPQTLIESFQFAGMNIGTESGLTSFPFDPIITNFQTQLSQEVDIRGGIASSSGFSFSVLYDGKEGNTQPSEDPLPRRCDATQNLEVLLGQNKHTWGSRRLLNPETTNGGIAYLESGIHPTNGPFKKFDTPPSLGFIPLTTTALVGTTPYWRQGFPLHWGNDTTDWVWFTNPVAPDVNNIDIPTGPITPPGFENGITTFVIPDAFGSHPSQPPPQGAEAWSTVPAGVGRRVRLWIIEDGVLNPFEGASRVFDGYVDDWSDSDNNTTINIALIDALSWLRTNTGKPGYKVRTDFPDSLNRRYRTLRRGESFSTPNPYRFRPFDIQPEIEFWEENGDLEADGLQPQRLRPQWVEFGGYAFPHSRLMELGGSARNFAVTQMVTPEIDYSQFPQFVREDLFEAFNLNDYTELEAKVSSFSIRKLGIALDEEDEKFDYDNDYDLETGVDAIYLTNGTRNLDGTSGNTRNWQDVMSDINLPHGYLQLPNKPHLDWLGYNLVDSVLPRRRRRTYELATDISIEFDRRRDSRVACIRLATFAYNVLARKIVREHIDEAKPIHVFFSSDETENTSGFNISKSLNQTDSGPGRTGQTGRTQATLVCQISLAELMLQVLTSTGRYRYTVEGTGSYHAPRVRPGDNGPWDTLPAEWGMAIPLPLIDTEQILNYRFIPYTNPDVRGLKAKITGGPPGVRLSDIYLENVWCRWDDTDDMAGWLSDRILKPLGLALVATPQGKIQVRTLDSFDEALFDPQTGSFRSEGVLTIDDLHSDSVEEPPYVSLSQRSSEIIQNFVVRYNDGLNRYSVRFPDRVGTENCHLPVTRFENSVVRLISKNDDKGKFIVPFVRNADLTNVTDGSGTPPLSIFGLIEKPTTYFHRRVGSGAPYLTNSTLLATMRSEKVNRWQVQRPEIEFEISPWWIGNQELTAGTSLLVDLPNVPNIDGSRGIVGVVLVLSVQFDIRTGVRIIRGRVVAQSAPIPPAFANRWFTTLEKATNQSGLNANQMRFSFVDELDYTQTLYSLGINELQNSSPVPSNLTNAAVSLLDEVGQVEVNTNVVNIIETNASNRTIVIEFTNNVTSDSALMIVRDISEQPSQTELTRLWRTGAFINPIWRFN